MVQPKLKEKDWKRNHHFVKVRSLDVFGTFQFQYIWFVYICGFIYWPFFGPPHPPSTWRLVACCPGKPLKLRHPCNRTWEPWHFTSKKKGWIQDGIFPLQKWKGWDLYKPQKGMKVKG